MTLVLPRSGTNRKCDPAMAVRRSSTTEGSDIKNILRRMTAEVSMVSWSPRDTYLQEVIS